MAPNFQAKPWEQVYMNSEGEFCCKPNFWSRVSYLYFRIFKQNRESLQIRNLLQFASMELLRGQAGRDSSLWKYGFRGSRVTLPLLFSYLEILAPSRLLFPFQDEFFGIWVLLHIAIFAKSTVSWRYITELLVPKGVGPVTLLVPFLGPVLLKISNLDCGPELLNYLRLQLRHSSTNVYQTMVRYRT